LKRICTSSWAITKNDFNKSHVTINFVVALCRCRLNL